MGHFLITTADERSWEFDKPVLFLGEWCHLYNRKQVWEKMDATVAAPFGLQPGQKKNDVDYIQALSSQLLIELTDVLNHFHSTSHSVRYWNILLGRWLQRYVILMFNRYFTLEQALNKHEVTGNRVFEHSGYSLATTDSAAFVYAEQDDIWNHVLYSKILNYFGGVNTELDFEALSGLKGFSREWEMNAVVQQSLKRYIRIVARKILPKFSRESDALIINSYLPKVEELKLQIGLGQFPQLWATPYYQSVLPDRLQRQRVSIDTANHTGFEYFLRKQLPEIIPSCFLEGYKQLIEQAKSLPWPAKPKFVFTSNNFDTDEIFKAWTALKVEEGRPYYVGQHGNQYWTRIDSRYWTEVVTCDKFLSWGKADISPKITPAFIFKLAGRAPITSDKNGGLLLIEAPPPTRIESEDSYCQHGIFQENQFRFVEALSDNIQQKLSVRLHRVFRTMCWCDDLRWKDRSPHIRVETGKRKLNDLIRQSRLVVHSYDSTGILETLAMNIPTLCFWHGGLDHLLPEAKPYYELLRDVNILQDTPEKAAEFITLHWDNISGWWESPKVQETRKIFCNQYARTEKKPIQTLKRLLLETQGVSKDTQY